MFAEGLWSAWPVQSVVRDCPVCCSVAPVSQRPRHLVAKIDFDTNVIARTYTLPPCSCIPLFGPTASSASLLPMTPWIQTFGCGTSASRSTAPIYLWHVRAFCRARTHPITTALVRLVIRHLTGTLSARASTATRDPGANSTASSLHRGHASIMPDVSAPVCRLVRSVGRR